MNMENDTKPTRSLLQVLQDVEPEPAGQDHHEAGPSDEAVSAYLTTRGFDLEALERQRVHLLKGLDELERAENEAAKAGLPGMSVITRGAHVLTSISAAILPRLHDLFMPDVTGFADAISPVGTRSDQSRAAHRAAPDHAVPDKASAVESLVAQGSRVILVDWASSEEGSKLTLAFLKEWPAVVPAVRVVVNDEPVEVTEDNLIEIPSAGLLHVLLPCEHRTMKAAHLEQTDDAIVIEIETGGQEA